MMGRCDNLTHTRATDISIYRSKSKVQWVRNIPLDSMKKELVLKIRSISSLLINKNRKNP
jgi:hypothetical protein